MLVTRSWRVESEGRDLVAEMCGRLALPTEERIVGPDGAAHPPGSLRLVRVDVKSVVGGWIATEFFEAL
jgi:hypothetical protein